MTEYEKFWDEMSKTEEVDYDDEMINRLLRLKAIQSHLSGVHKILDVGAATGAYSIPLAKLGFDVVHLDLSDEMIKAAKDKAIGLTNIQFINTMLVVWTYSRIMNLTLCYVLTGQFHSLEARQKM